MQLGLTWPLQRLLHTKVPYGAACDRGYCFDVHCITLHGRSSLLLVHCESRYTMARFGMTEYDWKRLEDICMEEIEVGFLEAGISNEQVQKFLSNAGPLTLTRTHGRREVAFLNRAWEDVLKLDILVDETTARQPVLNQMVNNCICRCAGREEKDTARNHLLRYFEKLR